MAFSQPSSGFLRHRPACLPSTQLPPPGMQPRLLLPLLLSGRPSSSSCRAQKRERSFTDQILDYIEGGPKLRRWYGAPDLQPKDGGQEDEEEVNAEDDEPRDAVLVTDGDSEIGQMIVLALIVKRARIKVLVKDKQATVEAFGNYVEPVNGDARSKSFPKEAVRGVRAIIFPPNEGFSLDLGQMNGVEHVILLSQLAAYKGSSGLQALVNANARKSAARYEDAVISSGIPYTIIRAALLENIPAGSQGFSFKQGVAASGRLSKEDAAYICVEALEVVPPKGLTFEVANGDETVSNWKEWFAARVSLKES